MKKKTTFDQIDDFFSTKKESEIILYFIFIFIVIVFLVDFIVRPMAQDFYDGEQSALNEISKKLNETNNYLISVSSPDGSDRNYKINQENKKLTNEKNNLRILKESNTFFDNKLLEVSSLTNDKKNWAKFLDSLTQNAQDNSIKIYHINSKINDIEFKKIQEMLNIEVKLEGQFNNVLKYINSVEESEMVVDLNGIDINTTSEDTIGGEIKISVWGMKYI